MRKCENLEDSLDREVVKSKLEACRIRCARGHRTVHPTSCTHPCSCLANDRSDVRIRRPDRTGRRRRDETEARRVHRGGKNGPKNSQEKRRRRKTKEKEKYQN